MNSNDNVTAVRDRHRDELMRFACVSGIGTGRDRDGDVVIIYLNSSDPAARRGLPEELDGFPVRFEVSGSLGAL
jgi:hypothetical protein